MSACSFLVVPPKKHLQILYPYDGMEVPCRFRLIWSAYRRSWGTQIASLSQGTQQTFTIHPLPVSLYIDGQLWKHFKKTALIEDTLLELPPGKHKITLRCKGKKKEIHLYTKEFYPFSFKEEKIASVITTEVDAEGFSPLLDEATNETLPYYIRENEQPKTFLKYKDTILILEGYLQNHVWWNGYLIGMTYHPTYAPQKGCYFLYAVQGDKVRLLLKKEVKLFEGGGHAAVLGLNSAPPYCENALVVQLWEETKNQWQTFLLYKDLQIKPYAATPSVNPIGCKKGIPLMQEDTIPKLPYFKNAFWQVVSFKETYLALDSNAEQPSVLYWKSNQWTPLYLPFKKEDFFFDAHRTATGIGVFVLGILPIPIVVWKSKPAQLSTLPLLIRSGVFQLPTARIYLK